MGLRSWINRKMTNPDVSAFGDNYNAIERYTGQHMPYWDDRTVPGHLQGNPLDANPQPGFANGHIAATDPTWKGPR